MSGTSPASSEFALSAATELLGRSRGRRRRARVWPAVVVTLAAVYFLLPLYGTAVFALSTGRAFSIQPLIDSLGDPGFQGSLALSVFFAIATTTATIVLVAPTAYLVVLRFPGLRAALDFLTILPFVIPPIILTLGLSEVYGIRSPVSLVGSPILLIGGYFTLTLPYVFRAIDNALRAIDVRTLSEASASLGAGPIRTFLRVIVPSVSLGLLSAALLSFTTIMGEFTLASLLDFGTFPTFLNGIYASESREASALVIVSFVITWAGVLGLAIVARRVPGSRAVIAAR